MMLVLDEALETRRELHGGGLHPCNEPLQFSAPWSTMFTQHQSKKKLSCREPKGEVREGGMHAADGSSPRKMPWNSYKSCRI